MAVDVAWDLSEVLVFAVGLALALLALILARAIASLVSALPFVGGTLESLLTSAIVDPLKTLTGSLERRMIAGASSLLDNLAVLLAIPLLIGIGVYKGFEYLWHEALKPLVAAAVHAALKVAYRAEALAKHAESTASHALHVAENLPTVDLPNLWRAIEHRVASDVSAGVTTAEKYASTAVAAVEDAPIQAVRNIDRLVTTAETDTAQAFTDALAYAEGLALPIGNDLTQLEEYIKSLGTAGLVAAIPALAYLVQSLVREAGLSDAECRSKNAGICGTDPLQWAGLLAALVPIGIAFDLQAIVDYAGTIAGAVETLVQQAA